MHGVTMKTSEDNVAPVTRVTYEVMIHVGQTLHKLAVTVTLKNTDTNNETLLCNFLNSVTSQSS